MSSPTNAEAIPILGERPEPNVEFRNPLYRGPVTEVKERTNKGPAVCCAFLSACTIGVVFLIDELAASHDSYLDEFSMLTIVLVLASLGLVFSIVKYCQQ